MIIPLEDTYTDVLGKALRGLNRTPSDLAQALAEPLETIQALFRGEWNEPLLRRAAGELSLRPSSLVALAERSWRPRPPEFFLGLAEFTVPWQDMFVNLYLVWHEPSQEAVLFDTGPDATGALNFLKAHELKLRAVFLTHTHGDHVFDLDRVCEQTGVPAYVHEQEPLAGAHSFSTGQTFAFSGWQVETRHTWGHSLGGTTYVVHGLPKPLAVVGDALFAGSIGGAKISYTDALRTNREQILSLPPETILCPGHGPLTTVAEERVFNPFFPELDSDEPFGSGSR